jgi:ABC-type transport system involved in multi-copper enzyme maturation permease subunit
VLRTIVARETLEYLKSAKLLIGLLITAALVVATTLINIEDYALRHQNYLDAQKELKSEGFQISVFRPPQVLSILARGKDRDLGDQAKISYMDIPSRLTGYLDVQQGKSHSLAQLSAVDFVFIVRVILSLLVVFLAYGAVSEEKAQGTLKLAMANALPRDRLLLGKLLAGLGVVWAILSVTALLAFIIMVVHPAVTLAKGDGNRIFFMFAGSALYLSVFFVLGLFVSVLTDRPATSLLVLLQIWIALVVIYPNLSVRLAEHAFPLPSEETLLAQKAAIHQQLQDEIERANEGLGRPSPTNEDRLRSIDVWSRIAAENSKVDQDFGRRQSRQRRGAELLSLLSPAAAYDQIMIRLAKTDIREYDRYMEGLRRLWEKFVERAKLRVTDPETFKRTPLPAFAYRSESPGAALTATWPLWGLLALSSLILFSLAATGFLRKDPR